MLAEFKQNVGFKLHEIPRNLELFDKKKERKKRKAKKTKQNGEVVPVAETIF